MIFKDKKHEDFYNFNIEKTNSFKDPYRKALFYLFGLTEETRKNIDSLYDFKERCIEFEGLRKSWQTGTTTRITRLAFNLFNGFSGNTGEEGNNDDCCNYTPYNLFDNSLMVYMLEAVKLLYPTYVKDSRTFGGIGYIYVLINKCYQPELYYVNYTTNENLQEEVDKLYDPDSMPGPFDIVYNIKTENALEKIKSIYGKLEHFRINKDRDFFKADLSLIKEIINHECYK